MAFRRREKGKYEYWVENRRVNGKVCQKHLGKDNQASLVTRLYRENIGPVPPVIADELEKAAGLPEQWVRVAFREAASHSTRSENKLNWAYIATILDRYQQEGFSPPRRESQGQAERDPLEATRKAGWKIKRSGPDDLPPLEPTKRHQWKVRRSGPGPNSGGDDQRRGGKREWVCPRCEFVAGNAGALGNHMKWAHERRDRK